MAVRTQIANLRSAGPLNVTEAREAEYREPGVGLAVYAAAAFSLVAAMVHLWATPQHAWIWWGYGAFFVAIALSQGLFSVVLLRWPSQLLAVAGILGNLTVILLYVFTRTSGVPLGPHAGKVEDAGLLDMTATVVEMGLVVVLVMLLSGAYRTRMLNALLLVGAAIWTLRLLGFLS